MRLLTHCLMLAFLNTAVILYPALAAADIEEARKECKKKEPSNMARYFDCVKAYKSSQKAAGVVRGTTQYCQQHYHPLDTTALTSKYRELRDLMENSRFEATDGLGAPGELTHTHYSVEVRCVAQELDRRGAWPIPKS